LKCSLVIGANRRSLGLAVWQRFRAAIEPDDKLAAFESLMGSLRATFEHWAYADLYRLREPVLWDLGLHVAIGDDFAEDTQGDASAPTSLLGSDADEVEG